MSTPIVRVCFVGHLTRDQVETALGTVPLRAHGRIGLLLDCSDMHGYDLDARHGFVEWNQRARAQLAAVGIVTSNSLWGMVIRAMSLASGVSMRAFPTTEAAERFLEQSA